MPLLDGSARQVTRCPKPSLTQRYIWQVACQGPACWRSEHGAPRRTVLKTGAMPFTEVFAGIAVRDRDAAIEFYERLLGAPPTMLPNNDEAA